MGNITLNKPSGGQLTIAPEDGTSTETVTIPAGGLMAADTPVGKVLQVVESANDTSIQRTTSMTWTSCGTTATITPTSATSKILVTVTFHQDTATYDPVHYLTIYANGVSIGEGTYGELARYHRVSGGRLLTMGSVEKLHSPNTTDPVTYTLMQRNSKTIESRVRNDLTPARIILMEVAA